MPQRWSQEVVEREIRRRANSGRSLRYTVVKQDYSRLVDAARRHHGSWREAVKAAGYDYNRIQGRRIWTKERVLATLRRLHESDNRLSHTTIKRTPYRSVLQQTKRAMGYFEGFPDAVKQAGIDYDSLPRYQPKQPPPVPDPPTVPDAPPMLAHCTRQKRGWTVVDTACKVGITPVELTAWEFGRIELPFPKVFLLSRLLEIPLCWLWKFSAKR